MEFCKASFTLEEFFARFSNFSDHRTPTWDTDAEFCCYPQFQILESGI